MSDWMTGTRLKHPQNKQETRQQNCRIGWLNIFLLSQADLIVRMGDGGVQAQGGHGVNLIFSPFLHSPWRWGSACQIKSHSSVFPPYCHVYSSELWVPTTSGNSQKG